MSDKGLIVVWFSCGAASAVAAKLTLELYSDNFDVRVVNNPVSEEDSDNRRFLRDIEKWLGVKIEIAINPEYPSYSAVDVWDKRKFMSSPAGAPCTLELKKKARIQWEQDNNPDYHVFGFTSEEQKRSERFELNEGRAIIPILIDKNISKLNCFEILGSAGINIPNIYKKGYPNANCIGCVKATSSTYWNHVRKQHPEVFRQRAEQSRKIGCKLVRYKGERIYLDELDPQAKGRPMKFTGVECGIFC